MSYNRYYTQSREEVQERAKRRKKKRRGKEKREEVAVPYLYDMIQKHGGYPDSGGTIVRCDILCNHDYS